MSDNKKQVVRKDAAWHELPVGGSIPDGGTAKEFKTGDWRSFRPIHDRKKCIDCMFCWAYCPDMSVIVEDGKVVGFDYDHCKGCGICAKVCPPRVSAITMVPDSEADAETKKEEEAV